jgi:hypothetical protein
MLRYRQSHRTTDGATAPRARRAGELPGEPLPQRGGDAVELGPQRALDGARVIAGADAAAR